MRYSVLALTLLLTAGPALAETAPSNPPQQQTPSVQLHKAKPKTSGVQMPAPSPSPNAGTTTPGAPAGTASNGGEMGN
jgi:hypothetical protein